MYDLSVRAALRDFFSGLLSANTNVSMTPIVVTVSQSRYEQGWHVSYQDKRTECNGLVELLYSLDKTITIAVQLIRTDLLFLHASCIRHNNYCFVIAGESGAGKSTLCWSLLQDGYGYMSDELAPIDPKELVVSPYSRGLVLKRLLPNLPELPDTTLRADNVCYVPADTMPFGAGEPSAVVAGIVFLSNDNTYQDGLTELSRAQAASHIYANSLNQLSHENDGLSAAAEIGKRVPCYKMTRGSLSSMTKTLRELIKKRASESTSLE
ncbi:MAG: hypothetical protein AAGA44_11300 [Pseudomonadota bacterium]